MNWIYNFYYHKNKGRQTVVGILIVYFAIRLLQVIAGSSNFCIKTKIKFIKNFEDDDKKLSVLIRAQSHKTIAILIQDKGEKKFSLLSD